jgi:integrase
MPLKLVEPRAGASKYWRVRGTYLGVSVNRSTQAVSRSVAAKVLKEYETEIERGRFAKKIGPTFAEAGVRYLREGKDPRFVDRLLDHFGETPLAEIDQRAIEDASHALLPGVTPATRNRCVFTPMSAILRHAGVDLRLRRPAGANGRRREFFFRPEQAEAVINAAMEQSEEFGVFLTFLLYTGCRLSEACGLQVADVELSRATALVRDTKNGTDRRVHLPPTLVAALAGHPRGLERVGKVFAFTKGSWLYARLQAAAEAAGVAIPDGVAFHAFRHSYGAYARRYGGLDTSGLVATGAWLSPDAARRYEHADVSEAARASDLFPVVWRRA